MGSTTALPDRLPGVATDSLVALVNYYGDTFLNVEMEFSHRLDADRLRRAVELTLRAEPVLGCRFVRHPWRPFWERVACEPEKLFSVATSREEFDEFRIASLREYENPQIRLCLYSDTDRDRLILKVAHQAADGGGCKHVASILSGIYTRLGHDPGYSPEPNLSGSRSSWQVLRLLPWHAFPRIYWNYLREAVYKLVPFVSHSLPASNCQRGKPVFVVRHIDEERVSRLAAHGRGHGATINDVMLAAFLRGLAEAANWDGRSVMRVMYTVDLRLRYLPSRRAGAVCNLSAIEYLTLADGPGASFDDTLSKIVRITSGRKRSYIGLCDYVGTFPSIKLMPFTLLVRLITSMFEFLVLKRNMPNALTNMGPIDPADVTFDWPAERAWILVPPIFPPLLGAGLTGYRGRLTLSVGTYPPGIDPLAVEGLFDALDRALPGKLS